MNIRQLALILIASSTSFATAADAFFTHSEATTADLAAFLKIQTFKTRVVSDADFTQLVARLSFMQKDISGTFKEIDSIEKSIATVPSRHADVTIFVSDTKIFLGVNNLNTAKESSAFLTLQKGARSWSWSNDISESILLKGPLEIFTSSPSEDSSDVTGKIQLSIQLK